MRVEESIEIARPPHEVWAFVVDPANDVSWCPKVRSVRADGDRRWVVTHKPIPLRPPAELIVEQLEAEEPRMLRLREEDAASVFHVTYRLDPAGDGTRFTQASEFEWKRLPRPLQVFLAGGVRRDVRRQLRELKTVLER